MYALRNMQIAKCSILL